MLYAKPIEELLKAPKDVQNAMLDFLDTMSASSALHMDIINRFDYPSLWAAIEKLLLYHNEMSRDENKFRAAGYTADDAFALKEYYGREDAKM